MKRILALLSLVVTLVATPQPAHAVFIVDTGIPTGVPWSLDPTQWLGAEFDLPQASLLTDVQGYIGGSGTATIAIYTDGGEVPGTELHSQAFLIAGPDAWQGVSGVAWSLPAGTYWATYEIRPTQTGSAYQWGRNQPFPLGNEANRQYPAAWGQSDSQDIGVRIQGTVGVIPEPSSLLLLGSGLLGLIARRRKRTGTPNAHPLIDTTL